MEQIVTCPHCGNETTHEIISEVESSERAYSTLNDDEFIDLDVKYYLTRCKTCFCISLFWDSEVDEHQGRLEEATICYPKQKYFGDEVPESIIKTYEEAKRIKHISPTSFAVMIRRGLEFLCLDKRATGRTLNKQLENLSKTGVIPQTLFEMVDTIRFLGNQGAHATVYKIGTTEYKQWTIFLLQ